LHGNAAAGRTVHDNEQNDSGAEIARTPNPVQAAPPAFPDRVPEKPDRPVNGNPRRQAHNDKYENQLEHFIKKLFFTTGYPRISPFLRFAISLF
jgi:hypothetical protein